MQFHRAGCPFYQHLIPNGMQKSANIRAIRVIRVPFCYSVIQLISYYEMLASAPADVVLISVNTPEIIGCLYIAHQLKRDFPQVR